MDTQFKNSTPLKKAMLIAGLILAAFTFVAALMVAITHQSTSERIEQNKRDFILKSLNDVMPTNSYDNDLIKDSFTTSHPYLGKEPSEIYPAFKNLNPSGAILTAVASNGYNGKIKILVGLDYAGVIHAVRVVEHKETPGLGDPIDIQRSDWIRQFDQKSISNPSNEQWFVKKDGGEFDQLTGATITPRAVVMAVSNALLYYNEHRDSIYSDRTNGSDK